MEIASARHMNRSQVSLTTVFTVCFGAVAALAFVYAAVEARLAITLTLLAATLAVALDHAVALLQRRRVPRWMAIVIVGMVLLGLGALLGVTIIPTAIEQTQVLAQRAPELAENIRKTHTFVVLDARFGVNDAIAHIGKDAPTLIFSAVNAVFTLVGAAVAVVLLAIFMLIFGAPLITRMLGETDAKQRRRLRGILATIYNLLGGYIGGIILIGACNAVATATFLAFLGMPFFVPLAMVSGLASAVPYVGSLITSVTISLLALATLGTWPAVACGVFFITYGQIEGSLLGPLIFRRTAHVNPLVTVLAILFFGTIGGVVGAFLAIPLVGVMHIVFREIMLSRRRQRAEEQQQPTALAS